MRLILHFVYKNSVYVFVALSVFVIFADFSYLKLNTADASLYLNCAENIANHKGFLVSDNLYQSFKGLYHPLLPYYQFLYSLFISLFINHGGIVQIIQINVLLFALNAALVFYLVQNLTPTRLNVLFIFFLVFSRNFFDSALFAWTEQFYFFFLLTAFVLFLKFKDSRCGLFWLGIFNGVLMLVRVAHFCNFMAFLPVLFLGAKAVRRKISLAFCFAGGFILALGLYQLFCYLAYHTFYPEVPRPAVSYGIARLTGGTIYHAGQVGIQAWMPLVSLKSFFHIAGHLRGFFHQMPLFLWPALFYFFLPPAKKPTGGLMELCLSQSLLTVLGNAFIFYSLPSALFESLRYSLIPYVLVSMVGWYCLHQGLLFLGPSKRKWIEGFFLSGLLVFQVHQFTAFRSGLFQRPLWAIPYYRDLMEGYRWIDKNLPEEALVASNEDQQSYFMHRPFISTPPGKSFNCANLGLYNDIYSPDYYLMSSGILDKCFTSIPHTKIFSNKTFRLLKVTR